jgi:hypothetical protein
LRYPLKPWDCSFFPVQGDGDSNQAPTDPVLRAMLKWNQSSLKYFHRPHPIYELVFPFLPRCTRTDYQLSIREEYTRALLLTQRHANKKIPLNTEL